MPVPHPSNSPKHPAANTSAADGRQFSPSSQRNREPLLAVLKSLLVEPTTVLEVASGTGEHALHFATHLPNITWLPSDRDIVALTSIAAWQARQPLPNLLPPIELDASAPLWPCETEPRPSQWQGIDLGAKPIGAIVNINMIHISPIAACQGLLTAAGRILPAGGLLIFYGPFQRDGQHTSASNAAFDLSLQSRNPEWGCGIWKRLQTWQAIAI